MCARPGFEHLWGVEAIAPHDAALDPELGSLRDDLNRFGEERAEHEHVGIGGFDFRELRLEVDVAGAVRLGVDDVDSGLLKLVDENLTVGFCEGVVVAVNDRGGFILPSIPGLFDGDRNDLLFRERVAEDARALGGDPRRGVRRCQNGDVGAHGDGLRLEGFAGERRPQNDRSAVGGGFLEQVDRLVRVGRAVLNVEGERVPARVQQAALQIVVGEQVCVFLLGAVDGGAAGDVGDYRRLDRLAGCERRSCSDECGGDERERREGCAWRPNPLLT